MAKKPPPKKKSQPPPAAPPQDPSAEMAALQALSGAMPQSGPPAGPMPPKKGGPYG